ncbi:hypothetical protein AB0P15_30960 [Streptomyces sp. NPDC087917]|uniref:hypothetical protein n=1 Tax=Streptomyces sp. NPDC087917 TaxID=3155060 RepID=UPI00343758CF
MGKQGKASDPAVRTQRLKDVFSSGVPTADDYANLIDFAAGTAAADAKEAERLTDAFGAGSVASEADWADLIDLAASGAGSGKAEAIERLKRAFGPGAVASAQDYSDLIDLAAVGQPR